MGLFSLWPFNKRHRTLGSDGLQLLMPEKSLLDAALASRAGAPLLEYDAATRSNFYDALRLPVLAWLMRQKPDACAILAARAALRCCRYGSIYSIEIGTSEPSAQESTLILLWAGAMALFAASHPHRASELRLDHAIFFVQSYIQKRGGYKSDYLLREMKAAECALRAAVSEANFGLAAAAFEFNASIAYSCPATDPAAEYSYSPSYAQDALAHVEFDIQMIEGGASAFELSQQPLSKASKPLNLQYATNPQAQPNSPETWRLWFEWHRSHTEGVAPRENVDFVYGSIPVGVIAKGPLAANAWLTTHLPQTLHLPH